ncbi:hypothetical protein SAMN05216489_04136 [Streptomyces sp. 3213]|uniref:hypothetical protein n=1 Tax=Streptomyces sp. 3213.3 TaxID=1855348 RepID=UPI0008988F88|nr:hypothetical protein [Streptomyces sp. 3213.3]SED69133.1 hypothetical protein SAMN05216489_04136 [Streptomyces sp. 3213] [Streptomyces sp. 3213.3]
MHPETHLALHHARTADLQAQAAAHRLAAEARAPRQELRTRLGWTLVEVGLRLAAAPNGPKPAVA